MEEPAPAAKARAPRADRRRGGGPRAPKDKDKRAKGPQYRQRGSARPAAASGDEDGAQTTSDSVEPADESDSGEPWRSRAWFEASGGDLAFAQWLLGRCSGVGDLSTPATAATVERVRELHQLQLRLRRELSLQSPTDEDHDEEEGEEDEGAQLWAVAELVEDASRVLRPSRHALMLSKREAMSASRKFDAGLEKIVVAEVVELATELLLSRATSADREWVTQWRALLAEELPSVDDDKAEVTPVDEQKETKEGEEDGEAAVSKKEKKRRERRANKVTREAEATADDQVAAFLQFLDDCDALTAGTAEAPAVTTSPAWAAELQRIYDDAHIGPQDEARRCDVARSIQSTLRQHVNKWRQCEVAPFGSSLSLFGSKNSDLDLCLIPKPASTDKPAATATPPAVSSRQIRQLIKAGPSTETPVAGEGETVESLLDLDDHATKSIAKLTQTLNELDKNDPEGKKEPKHRRQLAFFLEQWRLLSRAIGHQLASRGGSQSEAAKAHQAAAKARQAQVKAMIATNRRRIDDLYILQATLPRADCTIRQVIRGARIPIIRFVHTPSALDCDLCFENVLATRNTRLLRAYAQFDERARTLGLAVKFWAKQRGVSDAASGFLSSYTFVLLSIFFLQSRARVLPNLQAPELLKLANQPEELINGVNVAFCADLKLARSFHARQEAGSASSASISELLAGFFAFYATSFDFSRRVVTVREPDANATKTARWGLRRAKTWRISVEDPLETTRDLGCVLQFKGQEAILRELRRGHELLSQGASFTDVVCEPAAPAVTKKPAASKPKPEQGDKTAKKKKEERSYHIELWSADRELSKAAIVALFKSQEKSFRVGRIDAKSGNEKHKTWSVELVTQALQCPRWLVKKTRIDWEETQDGTTHTGSVWIRHVALHSNVPCTTCLSPLHDAKGCSGQADADVEDKKPQATRQYVVHVQLRGDADTSTAPAGRGKNARRKERRKDQRTARRQDAPEDGHENGSTPRDEAAVDGKAPRGVADTSEAAGESSKQSKKREDAKRGHGGRNNKVPRRGDDRDKRRQAKPKSSDGVEAPASR